MNDHSPKNLESEEKATKTTNNQINWFKTLHNRHWLLWSCIYSMFQRNTHTSTTYILQKLYLLPIV